jgi:hypothetical protein
MVGVLTAPRVALVACAELREFDLFNPVLNGSEMGATLSVNHPFNAPKWSLISLFDRVLEFAGLGEFKPTGDCGRHELGSETRRWIDCEPKFSVLTLFAECFLRDIMEGVAGLHLA